MRTIDHLVYCVPDLEAAMKHFLETYELAFIYGGQHVTKGTRNALLNIGNGAYLELLAVDKTNSNIPPPRWMGIDLISRPRLTRWAVKSNDIATDIAILTETHPDMGQFFSGSRKKSDGSMLKWEMTLPLAAPQVELLPFMIDWKDSAHPTVALPETCLLIELKASHPDPALVDPVLKKLSVDLKVETADKISLQAIIQTAKGILILE